MEDEIPVENNPVTETPVADNPPASEQETPTVEEPAGEPEPPRGPSAEDYKKGMFKAQAKVKELEALVSQQTPASNAPQMELDSEDQDALKILGDVIDQRLAPIKSQLESTVKAEAWNEMMSLPHSQALEPEITEEFKRLPASLSFQERVTIARSNAIANNLDVITKVNREIGREEGYSNRENKSQIRSVETPARSTEPGKANWQEKLESGERLTPEEYKANRPAILEWEKNQYK